MLAGYVLLGLQPLPVKALGPSGWSAPLVVVVRFAFSLIAIALVCVVRRRGLRTAQPRLLLSRGLLGAVAVVLYFTSIQLAGVGPGTLLNYTYPLWANLFAVVFLRHRAPRVFWLLLCAAFAGVWLILSPTFREGALSSSARLGELCGILSGVAAGAGVLSIKELRKTDESLTIMASFSVIGFLLALPLALVPGWFGLPANVPALGTGECALGLGVGALAFGGHFYFTRGYRGTSVQLATALALSVPVIAALSGALLLDEPLGPRFVLGGTLVLLACFGIGWLETQR